MQAQATPAVAVQATPADAARAFYHWYLAQLAAQRAPLQEKNRAELKRYVSQDLLRELDRRMRREDGLDADYFTQAQDFLDSWLTHMAAIPVATAGRRATVELTLGEGEDRHLLRVTLVNESGTWKIRRVVLAAR